LSRNNGKYAVSDVGSDDEEYLFYRCRTGMNQDGFILNVYYRDPQSGGKVNYLPANNPVKDQFLLKLLNWDRLNTNGDFRTTEVNGRRYFDFVNGITIRPETGRVIFTKVQPFGKHSECFRK
jgi:cell surface protein SprA